MEEIEEYRHDLWNEVLELARDRDIYDQEAFLRPRAKSCGTARRSPPIILPTAVILWAQTKR